MKAIRTLLPVLLPDVAAAAPARAPRAGPVRVVPSSRMTGIARMQAREGYACIGP